ncbi:MAG TPA: TlpA disulfide reductase family protein [Chitinophagaceae bacterium]|nr:TlpA disulfide reductase family protein [Chitinophagaceae bacterium]
MKLCLIIGFLFFSALIHAQEIKRIKVTELEKMIKESKTPLIVNFWATFCKPCIAEIPYFESAVNKYKKDGVTLLLVSLDLKEDYPKIKPLATKRNFTSPIVWLNETNADYFCPKVDSSWSGALPATLFINNKIGYRKFYEEQVKEEKLEKEIMAILGSR